MFKAISSQLLRSFCLASVLLIATGCDSQKAWPDMPLMFGQFEPQHDLLLVQFDSKTDVDDIHSVAAVATMLLHPDFAQVKYHAVAGAYGIQDGKYVPAPELFKLAFANHYSDAHTDRNQALAEVLSLVTATLQQGGDIWIAEAGQSDFSAAMIKALLRQNPNIATQQRVHIVQHSDWNQDSTSPDALAYVKTHSDYYKIADGNAVNNGTAGYKSDTSADWTRALANKNVGDLWQTAKQIADQYNGQDGRYNNESIGNGGFDFSDAAEMTWIFAVEDVPDVSTFFDKFLL
jgi:hypothetical protein